MPFQQIARSVSVSTPTVQSRVRRLINTGVIKKIAPIQQHGSDRIFQSGAVFFGNITERSQYLPNFILDIEKAASSFIQVELRLTQPADGELAFG